MQLLLKHDFNKAQGMTHEETHPVGDSTNGKEGALTTTPHSTGHLPMLLPLLTLSLLLAAPPNCVVAADVVA